MTSICPDTIAKVRQGEIIRIEAGGQLYDLYRLLDGDISKRFGKSSVSDAINEIDYSKFDHGFKDLCARFDNDKSHYCEFSKCLRASELNKENILIVPMEKSCRLSVANQGKKNVGYPVHRDSWFDLANDGVNFVVYLTDVPYYGNTIFYPELFGQEVLYDPDSRMLVDDTSLSRAVSFNCKAGDVLIFSGEHVHGGAIMDVNRLSVEFRTSYTGVGGRPNEGIEYRPVEYFSN